MSGSLSAARRNNHRWVLVSGRRTLSPRTGPNRMELTGAGDPTFGAKHLGVKSRLVRQADRVHTSHPNPTADLVGDRRSALSERTTGRHRAACRPSTPLTVFGNAVTGTAGRRVLAVAASSGLALTMGASSAAAVPQVDKVSDDQGLTIGVFDPFGDKDKAGAAATVSADADIEWEFVSAVVSSEAPPPPPPPEPEPAPAPAPAPERPAANTTASRDNERPEPPAQESSSEDSDSPSAAPASSSGSQIVDIARRYIGTPYVHGGASPS